MQMHFVMAPFFVSGNGEWACAAFFAVILNLFQDPPESDMGRELFTVYLLAPFVL